jgi:hypothetical protein
MSRHVVLAFIMLTVAAPASAQVRFPARPAGPNTWASGSVGLYQLQNMFDPGSDAFLDFGSIVQLRGTLERDLQRGAAIGAAVTFARAPLTYDGPDCSGCDADVSIWQALAILRIGGGGLGLQQVIELGAGVTGLGEVRERDGGRLAPETSINPTFSIGYGLGFAFSANTQLMFLQEIGLMVHRRGDRPAGDDSNLPRTYATRIGLRFGLGGWR